MKLSFILVAGGFKESFQHALDTYIASVEIFTGDMGKKKFPDMPKNFLCTSVFIHNGTITSVGSILDTMMTTSTCIQLDHGTWKQSGNTNVERSCSVTVTTRSATFLFGGESSGNTYEYLPKDSSTWLLGKTEIPGAIDYSNCCAIAVKSEQEIWLIGALDDRKSILCFNVNDHTFKKLPYQLNVERRGHKVGLIPNTNKIMITGGFNEKDNRLNSTEILDPYTGTVTIASPMNTNRDSHGIGIITLYDEEKLAVFGGTSFTLGKDSNLKYLDCIEVYNDQTGLWDTTDIKLSKPNMEFSCLDIKLKDIISQLQSTKD